MWWGTLCVYPQITLEAATVSPLVLEKVAVDPPGRCRSLQGPEREWGDASPVRPREGPRAGIAPAQLGLGGPLAPKRWNLPLPGCPTLLLPLEPREAGASGSSVSCLVLGALN